MRKATLLVVVSIIFCSTVTFAQGDISLWNKSVDGAGKSQYIPWITYDFGNVFFEARYNFDWSNATTIFVGKSYKTEKFTIIPEFGVIYGNKYRGISPQVLAFGKYKSCTWISINQISFGYVKKSPNFVYYWTELLWNANNVVSIGIGEQVYWEVGTDGSNPALDIGPVIKAHLPHNYYVKVWGTIDPAKTRTKKLFVGAGISF